MTADGIVVALFVATAILQLGSVIRLRHRRVGMLGP